jgi:hypothetical protein
LTTVAVSTATADLEIAADVETLYADGIVGRMGCLQP